MGFLIRSAFWFSLVLLLLPFGSGSGTNGEATVGPIEAIFAAREAVGDIAGMCERKPEVCETGRAALHTIGGRARDGAKLAYQMLDEKLAEPDPSISTGSVPAPPANQ